MITESQQKTIDDLKATFEQINALEQPPSDMMEEIGAELNKARALKLKSEAALKEAQSKAYEIMSSHVASVYKPILDKFLPDLKYEVYVGGGFHLGGVSYHTFTIKSLIYERKTEDKSKSYEFSGFQLKEGRNEPKTTNLSDFDAAFQKFVIDAVKSLESNYY